MFLRKFEEEEIKEIERIKSKFENAKKYIRMKMRELEPQNQPLEPTAPILTPEP